MARPELPLGTHGRVRVERRGDAWRARAKFRDFDGVTREVERRGHTRSAAEQNLQVAFRDRGARGGTAAVRSDGKVSDLAALWYAQLEGLSPSTMQAYADRLRLQVLPAFGNVRVRELTPGLIDRHLAAVRARHGASAARQTRNVLSGMCSLAVRNDALRSNPCRETRRISGAPRARPRALAVDEVSKLLDGLEGLPEAVRQDLPDLVAFLAATGARIGEACAVGWADVDFGENTVHLHGTVVRLRGAGLVIGSPKSTSSDRIIEPPMWCMRMLHARRLRQGGTSSSGIVFPAPRSGELRDPSNTRRELRKSFGVLGFDGVTSHTFRKTVATLMDEAGRTARETADQLGHSHPSITLDVYMGRKKRATGASSVLEQIRPTVDSLPE